MATERRVCEAHRILIEGQALGPHELYEADWKARLPDQKERLRPL